MAIQREIGTLVDISPADLAGLPNGYHSDPGPEQNGGAYELADFILEVSNAGDVGGLDEPIADLFLLRSLDGGVTYEDSASPDSTAGAAPHTAWIGTFVNGNDATGAMVAVIRDVALPPSKFKALVHNRSGNALTGATLKMLPFRRVDL